MSDAYAIVDIPKSLPIHGMALTSTGSSEAREEKEGYHKDTIGYLLYLLAP